MNLFGRHRSDTDTATPHPLDSELGTIIAQALGAIEDPEILEHLRTELAADRLFISCEVVDDGSNDAIFSVAGVPLVRAPSIVFNPSRYNADEN